MQHGGSAASALRATATSTSIRWRSGLQTARTIHLSSISSPSASRGSRVACCPANIARTLASLGQYIYAVDERSIYVNLLIGSTIETTLRDTDVRIEQRSGLMNGGALELDVRSSGTHPIVVRLRLPKWIEAPVFRLNGEEIQPAVENGYAVLAVNCAGEHHFTLSGSVPVHRCAANLCVRADVGRVALQKGPFVYCFEQQDNGENLAALRMAPDAAVEEKVPAEGLPATCRSWT